MTALFIHIGDIHLRHGHPRNPDRLAALAQIIDESHAEPVSAYLIPGDLFDTKSTVDDRNLLADTLQDFAAHAPVVLVRGNHDAPGDLDIFARLKTRWPVYVVTQPQVLQVPLATGGTAAIAALPYPDKSVLVSRGVTPGETSQTARELLDVIFMQFAQELSTLRVGGAIPLFIGHVNVRGSISSTGQPQVGTELEIDQAILARLPVVYAGLSHIHRPQEVGIGVYAGSIARLDYGEVEEKSYVAVMCERGAGGWTASYERRSIDVPPMIHIDGRLYRDGFHFEHDDWMCLTCSGTGAGVYHEGEGALPCAFCDGTGQRASWAGCDVRVRYRYLASERAALSEACIRERFNDALRLKIESFAEVDRDLRAPEVAAAKTLPDKLAAFYKVERLTPAVADKLAWLERDDQTQLLAHVAASLKAIESPAPAERATVAA